HVPAPDRDAITAEAARVLAVTAPAATHDIRVVTAASLRRRRYGLAVSAPATGLTATIASVV
ncbi:MAG TPA: hypothetical protein VIH64_13020, partial [Streptosporangiaceae bacterium]